MIKVIEILFYVICGAAFLWVAFVYMTPEKIEEEHRKMKEERKKEEGK